MNNVIVLNLDYTYLNTVSWKKAVTYIITKKAESLRKSDKEIANVDRSIVVKVPLVIRLLKFVKGMLSKNVPFSYKNVYIRDNFTCQYCGSTQDLTIDHVLPKACGGRSTFENCVVACKTCNNKKGDRCDIKPDISPRNPSLVEFLKKKLKRSGLQFVLDELWS